MHINGFEFVERPEYDFEDHATLLEGKAYKAARQRVNREFAPKVLELCKKTAGADKAFWMSSQRRAGNAINNVAEVDMLWDLPTQIMVLKMRVNLESFWSIVTVCH